MRVIYLRCCRIWPIAIGGYPVGRCGLCGTRPEERPTKAEVEQYLAERR